MIEDEDMFHQSSWIDVNYCGKEVRVSDLTRRSTVTQVLRKLVKQLGLRNETSWEIVEEWRGTERPLPTRTRLLKVWHAWSSEQKYVTFRLQISSKRSAHYRHRRRQRLSAREGQQRYISEWSESESSSSTDSFLSDSLLSDSSSESDSDFEFTRSENRSLLPARKSDCEERKKTLALVERQQASLTSMAKNEAQLNTQIEAELAKIEAGVKQEALLEAIESTQQQLANIEERLSPLKTEMVELNSQIEELASSSSQKNSLYQLRAAIEAQMEIAKRLDDEADELAAAQHDLAECFEDREQFLLDSIHSNSFNSSAQVSLFRNDEHETRSQQSTSSTCSEGNADADDEWSLDRLSSFDEKQEKAQPVGGRQKPVYSTSTTCSDSGHVSDGSDSKNGSADRFSFTDSAIDSSTESKAKIRCSSPVESDSDSVRLNYVQQLRQSSFIIRSTSIRLSRETRWQNSSLQKTKETSPGKKLLPKVSPAFETLV